jgi:DNA repair exonuclease SbcCD nuclease subunit
MNVTFIHTADWQLGKPFAGVADTHKRALLQNERLSVINRIGDVARERGASFVLVSGDLFDSPSATQTTVSAACGAIGAVGLPVYVIPGNHDHGGPGCLWDQEFYQREQNQLAPNLHVLLKQEPVELDNAVLFPCPLLRRHEVSDPTTWLRAIDDLDDRFGDKPRIVVAHGSVLNFGGATDDEESDGGVPNLIDLQRLPTTLFEYIALGDWHGTKQVGDNAWYPGTPELDRFVKGADHDPGNILVVEASRGLNPKVECLRTGSIGWHEMEFGFADDAGLEVLEARITELTGNRVNGDLLRLRLQGSLGIAACSRLEQLIESWTARLVRLKLVNQTIVAPSQEEIDELTRRAGDPLVARVATRLVEQTTGTGEQAAIARVALRELHAACQTKEGN